MYSMPIVGTNATLYFPSESSQGSIVTGCVRTNGSDREAFTVGQPLELNLMDLYCMV